MTLGERFAQLEPRERRLAMVLVALFGVFVVIGIPVMITSAVGSKRTDNEALQEAILKIRQGRAQYAARSANQDAVVERYAKTTPALAGFLDRLAKQNKVDIPESQDQATVPHGKLYEERSTRITLRKVGMLPLAKFMEAIERSGYPVKISKLNVRRSGSQPDQYDVSMTVSAFDRKEAEKKKAGDETGGEEG